MERKHARTAIEIDARLIGKKTVPKGCRVVNISQAGMMLQCEPDGRMTAFKWGDNVDIQLLFHHHKGYKTLKVTAVVRHVGRNYVGVKFQQPDSELQELLNAYKTGELHKLDASIKHTRDQAEDSESLNVSDIKVTSNIDEEATVDAEQGREYAEQGREDAEQGREDAEQVREDEEQGREDTEQGRELVKKIKSRPVYAGLAALIIMVSAIIGTYLYSSKISSRLSALETLTSNYTSEPGEIQTRTSADENLEGKFAYLNASMKALADSFKLLEKNISHIIQPQPAATTATGPALDQPTIIEPWISDATLLPVMTSAGKTSTSDLEADRSTPETEASLTKSSTRTQEADRSTAETITRPAKSSASDLETDKASVMTVESTEKSSATILEAEEEKVAVISRDEKPTEPRTDASAAKPAKQVAAEKITTKETADGPWVINLLSSRVLADLDRLANRAQTHNIPVQQNKVMVKGKEYWRLQVTGFMTAEDARHYAELVKTKLKIREVWIFKRRDQEMAL